VRSLVPVTDPLFAPSGWQPVDRDNEAESDLPNGPARSQVPLAEGIRPGWHRGFRARETGPELAGPELAGRGDEEHRAAEPECHSPETCARAA